MVKKKNNKVLIGSIIIILTVVSIFALITFSSDTDDDQELLSVSFINEPSIEVNNLDFCNSEQECLNYLSQQGMPEDFLQLKGYKILCQNGNCYTQKI